MLPMFICCNELDFSFRKRLNGKFFHWVCSAGKAVSIDDGSIELSNHGMIYHLAKYPIKNKKTLRLHFQAGGKGAVGIFIYDQRGNLVKRFSERLPNSKEMRLFQVEYDLAKELAGLQQNSLTVRLFFSSRDKLTISDKELLCQFE